LAHGAFCYWNDGDDGTDAMVTRSNAWAILVLVLMALLAESMLVSDPDVFSYDPDDEYGPESWKYLPIERNECGGRRQSGIDIPTRPCEDRALQYHFKVSDEEASQAVI
jgi:carbonic anhydrase